MKTVLPTVRHVSMDRKNYFAFARCQLQHIYQSIKLNKGEKLLSKSLRIAFDFNWNTAVVGATTHMNNNNLGVIFIASHSLSYLIL